MSAELDASDCLPLFDSAICALYDLIASNSQTSSLLCITAVLSPHPSSDPWGMWLTSLGTTSALRRHPFP